MAEKINELALNNNHSLTHYIGYFVLYAWSPNEI
jgi:hypothetical protein